MSAHPPLPNPGPISPPGADFVFEDLRIERVILHPLQTRAQDGSGLSPPRFAQEVWQLPPEGLDALQSRVTDAMKKKAHAVEMSVENTAPDSFFQRAAHMLNGRDPRFVETSQWMAAELGKAQLSTSAETGMLIVLKGRVGSGAHRFVGVIKADVVDGFAESRNDVRYLEHVFLTRSHRLHKLGMLVEVVATRPDDDELFDAGNYRAFLFDHLLTATETKNAAAYFHFGLLGFGMQKSAKKLTQDFFESSKKFIATHGLSPEEQTMYREAIRTELRSNNAQLNVTRFAKEHLPEPLRRPYAQFMYDQGFPKQSVMKDTTYVQHKLRRPRRIVFSTLVKIETPRLDLVDIVERGSETTTLRIHGRITSED